MFPKRFARQRNYDNEKKVADNAAPLEVTSVHPLELKINTVCLCRSRSQYIYVDVLLKSDFFSLSLLFWYFFIAFARLCFIFS